jgi:hypothetical protein
LLSFKAKREVQLDWGRCQRSSLIEYHGEGVKNVGKGEKKSFMVELLHK